MRLTHLNKNDNNNKEVIIMTNKEKEFLQKALSMYLKDLWNRSDSIIDSDIEEYERLQEEHFAIRRFIIDNELKMPFEVESRF